MLQKAANYMFAGYIYVVLQLWFDIVHTFTFHETAQTPWKICRPPQLDGRHFRRKRYPSTLYDSMNHNNQQNSIGKDNKFLSSSDAEKRNEEKRRLERANDVVISKTSALPGAKDYELNIQSTQELYLQQASTLEREVYQLTELGMQKLKSFQLRESDQCFNEVFTLKPNAYVWQAGIVKFYLNQVQDAAKIFAKCANIYESKFGEPATEERIWRHACALKLYHQMSRQEKKALLPDSTNDKSENKNSKPFIGSAIDSLVPTIPISEYTTLDVLVRGERRKVMRIARELYSSSVDHNHGLTILSRAKLRSMGATSDTLRKKVIIDHKLWKLNSLFYLGLHYDVLGKTSESKQCMKNALRLCPSNGNGSDIIHTLPMLHMTARDWYDEDNIADDDHHQNQDSRPLNPNLVASDGHDSLLSQSIKSCVEELKLSELKDSMRARNLRVVGSKDELRDRLYQSLMNDPELRS